MTKVSPDNTDTFVGQRVRMTRLMANMSQTDLGAKIGVTFQQVQKYEKGSNRIGSSRMLRIAEALGKPVAWFFDEQAAKNPEADVVQRMLTAPHGIDVVNAFLMIEDNADRVMVAKIVERLAGEARAGRQVSARAKRRAA